MAKKCARFCHCTAVDFDQPQEYLVDQCSRLSVWPARSRPMCRRASRWSSPWTSGTSCSNAAPSPRPHAISNSVGVADGSDIAEILGHSGLPARTNFRGTPMTAAPAVQSQRGAPIAQGDMPSRNAFTYFAVSSFSSVSGLPNLGKLGRRSVQEIGDQTAWDLYSLQGKTGPFRSPNRKHIVLRPEGIRRFGVIRQSDVSH